MVYGDKTTCKACSREIVQIGGGHRQRQYCNDSCKQRAYQERKEQAYLASLRALWAGYLPQTQEFLMFLTRQYSEVVNWLNVRTQMLDRGPFVRTLGPKVYG